MVEASSREDAIAELERVVRDAGVLAATLQTEPSAAVGCYEGWTLVELAGHVGQIHRWVTGVVSERVLDRPQGGHPPAPTDAIELAAWVVDGADELVDVLRSADPDDEVWTISRTRRDVAFWRQRMVLETALHRWDAEDALGSGATVDDEVALSGIEEALDVYLAQRLEGHEVGGRGQRVAVAPTGADGWTATLRPDGFGVEAGTEEAEARIAGTPLDLWLLLTCRRALDGLDVTGDREAAALAVAAARMVPGPAG